MAFQVTHWERIRLSMQEMQVQYLGREDLLKQEMATHSSFLAWRIPRMEEPDGYSPGGRKESNTNVHSSCFSSVSGTSKPRARAGSCLIQALNSLFQQNTVPSTSLPCPLSSQTYSGFHTVTNAPKSIPPVFKPSKKGERFFSELDKKSWAY